MTRFRDPFKKVQPLPRFDVFQCTDPACPRCHGTGKYFVLDPKQPLVRWVVNPARIDLPSIQKKEVFCIKLDWLQRGPGDPRSPEENRISAELKKFSQERRIHNG